MDRLIAFILYLISSSGEIGFLFVQSLVKIQKFIENRINSLSDYSWFWVLWGIPMFCLGLWIAISLHRIANKLE